MGLSSSLNAGVMGLSVNATKLGTISENIANSDTPGFKAKDIEPFSDAFARAQRTGEVEFRVEPITTGAPSPNGNTVSLEDQMARSSGALRDHETAMAVYSKAMTMLRTSIGRR